MVDAQGWHDLPARGARNPESPPEWLPAPLRTPPLELFTRNFLREL